MPLFPPSTFKTEDPLEIYLTCTDYISIESKIKSICLGPGGRSFVSTMLTSMVHNQITHSLSSEEL